MSPFAVNSSQKYRLHGSLCFLFGLGPWGDDQGRKSHPGAVAGVFVREGPAFSCPWIPPHAMSTSDSTDEAIWLCSFCC